MSYLNQHFFTTTIYHMRTLFFTLFLLFSFGAFAQTYTVVADSLRLPNGIEFDAQGRLWVTESGYGFNDGAVSIVQPDGALLPVVTELPAFYDTTSQENVGPWHTVVLNGNELGVLSPINGGILIFNLAGFTPGVSQPLTAASATTVPIADFVFQNQPPGMGDSNPYTAVRDANGNWYVADAGFNGIVRVAASDGQRSVFCKFDPIANPTPVGPPFIDAVPTRIIAKPGGGFYVCNLTGFPFLEGSASIFEVSDNGTVSTLHTGLNMLTDLALDASTGDLFALQFGAFDFSIFNIAPNSGKVWRIHPDGTKEAVIENISYAPGMALDGQGNVYVSELASGRILRFDGAASGIAEKSTEVTSLRLSPNPAIEVVNIDFTLPDASPVRISVLDAAGKTVYSRSLGLMETGAHQFTLPLSEYSKGCYWVDIQTANGVKTSQLVVVK